MSTEIDEVQDFLTLVGKQGLVNENTINGRKTALTKFTSVLDESHQTVEYVIGNIDVIKVRFQNLNKEVRGATVDEYARRVLVAVTEFQSWSTDRGAWEKGVGAKGAKSSEGAEKKASKQEKQIKVEQVSQPKLAEGTRLVAIPIRPDFDFSCVVPKDLKINEVRKIAYMLAGYVVDYDPTQPKSLQSLLDFKEGNPGVNN